MKKPRLPEIGQTGTADFGIGLLKARVCSKPSEGGLGFLFRELATADKGLDAQIEITDESAGRTVATGKIISVQVKTGDSYFARDEGDSWSVPIRETTVNYWRSHSVPVLLVLVRPKDSQCFWVRGDANHRKAKTGFALRVPKRNVLDARARHVLSRIAENTTAAGRRLAELESEVPLMLTLAQGTPLGLDVRHWFNKSSGRCDVVIGRALDDSYQGDPRGLDAIVSWTALAASRSVASIVPPWADAEVDVEFYEGMRDDLYDEYLNEMGTPDHETGGMIDSVGIFDEWLARRENAEGIAPYEEIAAEMACYRYRLALNDFGRAFLKVHEYIHS